MEKLMALAMAMQRKAMVTPMAPRKHMVTPIMGMKAMATLMVMHIS